MQKMAPIPEDRIKPAPPFANVGLDFAGPLLLKDSGEKAYICLFTCAVTRAIHLELVSNMTAERFLLALRRMVQEEECAVLFGQIMPKHSRVLINICSNAGEYLKLTKLKTHCLKGRLSGSI